MLSRARSREVSSARFLRIAVLAVLSLFVVVTTGAVVRLTASGLGCDNWPRCGSTPFPEKGGHAFIEFGNRVIAFSSIVVTLIAWLASRRVSVLPPWVRTLALAVWLGTVAQIPLGGITYLVWRRKSGWRAPIRALAHEQYPVQAAGAVREAGEGERDRGLVEQADQGDEQPSRVAPS